MSAEVELEAPKKSRFPDSLVLIFSMIFVAQLLTYIIPSGTFDRAPKVEGGRDMVVPGTYKEIPAEQANTLDPWAFLESIPKGLAAAQEIIFLILLVGGVIGLLRASGSIDAFLLSAVRKFERTPALLIGGTMLLFGVGSFTIGMGEEYMPLVPLLVTMCLAMKLDAVVAMGILWGSYGIGWATAGTNPFGVLIAQDIAGVPPTSGLWLRIAIFLLFTIVAFHHVYRYAMRVKADRSASMVADVSYADGFEPPKNTKVNPARIAIMTVFIGGIAFFVYGAQTQHWYIGELNTIFLGIGLATILISRMSANEASQTFLKGAAEMTSAALIIGFARTIEVVLVDGQIIDTIINSIASLLEGAGSSVAAVGMLVVQSITNLFIPSGSGQAFVTMPIMSPLAELTGVPQQVAVLAYQFGDGLTNMIVPTNALVLGTLALARVPFTTWVKFIAPLLGKLLLVGVAVLVLGVQFPAILT